MPGMAFPPLSDGLKKLYTSSCQADEKSVSLWRSTAKWYCFDETE